MTSLPRLLAVAWFLAVLPGTGTAQYAARPSTGLRSRPASAFRFTAAAKAELQSLWRESQMAGAERVACLGGQLAGDSVLVTAVLPLGSEGADSLGVSAQESIERCGPPEWHGTVHTHIALHDGVHPYPTFSGADRGVMLMWWRRWKADGIFCVLYTREDAYCEVDGVDHRVMSNSAY